MVDWSWPLTSTNRVTKSGPDTSRKVVVQFRFQINSESLPYRLTIGKMLGQIDLCSESWVRKPTGSRNAGVVLQR